MKWKTYKQTKKTYPPTLSFRFDGEIKFFKGKQGAKTDPEAQILCLSIGFSRQEYWSGVPLRKGHQERMGGKESCHQYFTCGNY